MEQNWRILCFLGPAIRAESEAEEQSILYAVSVSGSPATDDVCRCSVTFSLKCFRVVAVHHLLDDWQGRNSMVLWDLWTLGCNLVFRKLKHMSE